MKTVSNILKLDFYFWEFQTEKNYVQPLWFCIGSKSQLSVYFLTHLNEATTMKLLQTNIECIFMVIAIGIAIKNCMIKFSLIQLVLSLFAVCSSFKKLFKFFFCNSQFTPNGYTLRHLCHSDSRGHRPLLLRSYFWKNYWT